MQAQDVFGAVVERAHLGGLVVMAFGATSSNAIESIGFAIALVACVLRAPKLLPDLKVLAKQPVVWTFTALLALIWIGHLWGDVDPKGWFREFERMMLLPWLLWPARSHARMLILSLLSGAVISVVILTIGNVTAEGFMIGRVTTYGKDMGVLGAAYAAAFVAAATAPERTVPLGLWIRVVVMAVLAWGVYLMGQRTPQVVAVIAAIFVIAVSPIRPEWRRWSAAAIILTMLAVVFIARPPARLSTSVALALSDETQSLNDGELVRQMTSSRFQLAAAALQIWRDHPWFGSGSGSFKGELTRIVTNSPESIRLPKERVKRFTQLTTAHNGFLDELACRGVLGLSLLVACLAMIARAAWRPPGNLVLAASLLAWCLFSFANATTQRGTFQIMLAAMVTCAAAVRVGSAGEADRTPSTPPICS